MSDRSVVWLFTACLRNLTRCSRPGVSRRSHVGAGGRARLPSLRSRPVSQSRASGASPSCLGAVPRSNTRRPAGCPRRRSPAPDEQPPATQITSLAAGNRIREVLGRGARIGPPPPGRLHGYSPGRRRELYPRHPHWRAVERVAVSATIGAGKNGGRRLSLQFRVDTPYLRRILSPSRKPAGGARRLSSFYTLPDAPASPPDRHHPDRDPGRRTFSRPTAGPGSYGPLIYTPQGQLVCSTAVGSRRGGEP